MRILRSANLTIVGMVILMSWMLGSSLAVAGEIKNLLENDDPGFENGIIKGTWFKDGAVFEVVNKLKDAEVEEDPIEGDFCLHVIVNEKGENPWSSRFDRRNWVFEKGKIYTLSALIKSNVDKMKILFKLEMASEPWTGYGNQVFTITEKTWQEYHTTTLVIPSKIDPATITFQFAFDPCEFWIDGIRFYEGEYVPTEIEGVQKAVVTPRNKLATTWGEVKAQY